MILETVDSLRCCRAIAEAANHGQVLLLRYLKKWCRVCHAILLALNAQTCHTHPCTK